MTLHGTYNKQQGKGGEKEKEEARTTKASKSDQLQPPKASDTY